MRLKTKQVGTVGTVSTYLGPKRMETVSSAQRYYAPKTQQIRNRLKPFQTVWNRFKPFLEPVYNITGWNRWNRFHLYLLETDRNRRNRPYVSWKHP